MIALFMRAFRSTIIIVDMTGQKNKHYIDNFNFMSSLLIKFLSREKQAGYSAHSVISFLGGQIIIRKH